MSSVDVPKLTENMQTALNEYYAREHPPIVFTRAESDYLIRTLAHACSGLLARRKAFAKRNAGTFPDTLELTQAEVDLALLDSIVRKLLPNG